MLGGGRASSCWDTGSPEFGFPSAPSVHSSAPERVVAGAGAVGAAWEMAETLLPSQSLFLVTTWSSRLKRCHLGTIKRIEGDLKRRAQADGGVAVEWEGSSRLRASGPVVGMSLLTWGQLGEDSDVRKMDHI